MTENARLHKTWIKCVDCGETVSLTSRAEIGQIVRCSKCGTVMEVISLTPIEVDWAYNEPVYADDDGEAW